ncbi:hypothetical protein CRG98_000746 [Punica granatum]|uniref:Uncharacterized protein n=1 Tax=Punica granatum TaxID=22663 RepID=A0A2I0LDX6_PUNGR|nr:hypothetical protein CRG98_000746 [Punica granatum]
MKAWSVVFKLLGYFQPRVQEKLGVDGLAREELPLGNSWVPQPKRRNREKAQVSIDRTFEARDSGACGGGTPECARGVPGDMGGGKCLNGAPEYAIGMPAIIGGGGGPYIVSV